jgi:hypothetical protein
MIKNTLCTYNSMYLICSCLTTVAYLAHKHLIATYILIYVASIMQIRKYSRCLYTTVRQPHIEHVQLKLLLHCCNVIVHCTSMAAKSLLCCYNVILLYPLCLNILMYAFWWWHVKGRNMWESTDYLYYTHCVGQVLALQMEVYPIAWNKPIWVFDLWNET